MRRCDHCGTMDWSPRLLTHDENGRALPRELRGQVSRCLRILWPGGHQILGGAKYHRDETTDRVTAGGFRRKPTPNPDNL